MGWRAGLPLPSCVPLGKSLNLFELWFPHLQRLFQGLKNNLKTSLRLCHSLTHLPLFCQTFIHILSLLKMVYLILTLLSKEIPVSSWSVRPCMIWPCPPCLIIHQHPPYLLCTNQPAYPSVPQAANSPSHHRDFAHAVPSPHPTPSLLHLVDLVNLVVACVSMCALAARKL